MRSQLTAMLAVALAIAGQAQGATLSPRASAALERRAHVKMQELEFEGAVPLLRRVAQAAVLPPAELARVDLDLGLCLANLGRDAEAKRAFSHALDLDAALALAGEVSPKIRALFEDARRTIAPPPAPSPPAAPAPVVQAPPTPPAPAPPPAAAAVVERPPARGRSLAAPIALEAVAAVALGVGIGAGIASGNAARSLQSGLNPRAAVDGLVSQQGSFAAVSITSYVAAGAAAVAGVVVYLLEGRPAGDAAPEARPLGTTPFAFSF